MAAQQGHLELAFEASDLLAGIDEVDSLLMKAEIAAAASKSGEANHSDRNAPRRDGGRDRSGARCRPIRSRPQDRDGGFGWLARPKTPLSSSV